MKKLNFWLLASLFVAAFTLAACGDDEEETTGGDKEWVGTWESTGTGAFDDASEVSTRYKLVLKADKSVVFTYKMFGPSGGLHNAYQMKGTFTTKDNVATVNYTKFNWVDTNDGVTLLDTEDTNRTYTYTYKFENGRLLISGDNDSNGGVLDNVVFVKK